jgi:hypothetical protein
MSPVYKFSNAGGFTSKQRYTSMLAGNAAYVLPDDFESIATVTSSGSSGDMVFSSIPGTYEHLQIRGILRTNDTGTLNNQRMRFNSDTGSNYAFHVLSGNGTTVSASATTSATSINDFMRGASDSLTSGIYSAAVIDILDYAKTSKYKTIRVLQGTDINSGGVIGITSGLWQSTSAITTITISPSGGTAIQYSTFALYGIKGVA